MTDRSVEPLTLPNSGDTAPIMFLTLRATPGQPSYWAFDCPWCGGVHSHGDVAGRWGLRYSHCDKHRDRVYVILPNSSLYGEWPVGTLAA